MWRDEAFLLDMLLAARELRQFTDGVSFEKFNTDRLLQHAVVRLVEIIGEAARNVSPDFKRAHPEIPWSGIVGMRHRLIHEYFRVAPDKVWEVVHKDLPELVALIEPLVPRDEPSAEGHR
jgi:uncharacterized protein with HEPN domain